MATATQMTRLALMAELDAAEEPTVSLLDTGAAVGWDLYVLDEETEVDVDDDDDDPIADEELPVGTGVGVGVTITAEVVLDGTIVEEVSVPKYPP